MPPPPGPPVLARCGTPGFPRSASHRHLGSRRRRRRRNHLDWADGGASAVSIDGHDGARGLRVSLASGFRSATGPRLRGAQAAWLDGVAASKPASNRRERSASRLATFRSRRSTDSSLRRWASSPRATNTSSRRWHAPDRDTPVRSRRSDRARRTAELSSIRLSTTRSARAATSADADRATRDIAASVQRRIGRVSRRAPESHCQRSSRTLPWLRIFVFRAGCSSTPSLRLPRRRAEPSQSVHVPPHPGRNGTARWCRAHSWWRGGSSRRKKAVHPIWVRATPIGQIKEALDNCKLSYDFCSAKID